MKKTILKTVTALLFSASLFAQQYIPDTAFGNNGIYTANYALYSSQFDGFDIQSNGNIVTAGSSMSGIFEYNGFVTQHQPNGTPETSFGNNGYFACVEEIDACSALKVLEDDSFLLLETGEVSYLKKYNSNGIPFEGFGTNSSVTIGNVRSTSMQVQSDGKIIVQATPGLRRFNTDGSSDINYGTNGFTIDEFPYFTILSIAIDENDNAIVGGQVYDETDSSYDMMLVKYTSQGLKDTSFGNEGVVVIDPWNISGNKSISSVKLYENKIFAGGRVNEIMALVRLNNDGTMDNDFGINGTSLISFDGYNGRIADIDIQGNGKIIASGFMLSIQEGENGKGALVAITPEGIVDTFFGDEGKILISGEPGFACSLGHLEHLNDDSVVVSGFSGQNAVLAKFIPEDITGIHDVPEKVKLVAYPNPITDSSILQYSLPDEATVTITLTDMQGRVVTTYMDSITANAGNHSLQLAMPGDLASGMYTITLHTAAGRTNIKVIK